MQIAVLLAKEQILGSSLLGRISPMCISCFVSCYCFGHVYFLACYLLLLSGVHWLIFMFVVILVDFWLSDQYALGFAGYKLKETSEKGPRPERPIEIYEFDR